MSTMIAYCGLLCDQCPVLLATLEKDHARQLEMRESIIEMCFSQYGIRLKIEDITDCDGCKANTGKLFSGCWECKIRGCALNKKIENCAYCEEYVCDTLEKHFQQDPDAKRRLNRINMV